MPLAVDLHENLIQMPAQLAGFHARNPPFSDLGREHRPKPMPPISHSLVADIDAPFMKRIFHISKRQRKSHVEHHRQADNLTARFEVAKWVRFGHIQTVRNRPTRLKLVCSDSALDLLRRRRVWIRLMAGRFFGKNVLLVALAGRNATLDRIRFDFVRCFPAEFRTKPRPSVSFYGFFYSFGHALR